MFFYIDESGHTGGNLFDPNQPTLYYGVLSSRINVDLLANPQIQQLRDQLAVSHLHAADLGNRRLSTIAPGLLTMQKKLALTFDLHSVKKSDHSIISFFNIVFDHAVNPVVPPHNYGTSRFVLLVRFADLFDEPLARKAWSTRIDFNQAKAAGDLRDICNTLQQRCDLNDRGIRELVGGPLDWAARNPDAIRYNVRSKAELLESAPNFVGFQSVMLGVASRIRKVCPSKVEVTVDQQSQFNKSQQSVAQFYANAKGVRLKSPPSLPELDFRGMPDGPIRFASSYQSAGLELTDLYLWAFKRHIEKKDLASELYPLIYKQLHRGQAFDISLAAIGQRFRK
jgi:uncharacterized protein DUF3800